MSGKSKTIHQVGDRLTLLHKDLNKGKPLDVFVVSRYTNIIDLYYIVSPCKPIVKRDWVGTATYSISAPSLHKMVVERKKVLETVYLSSILRYKHGGTPDKFLVNPLKDPSKYKEGDIVYVESGSSDRPTGYVALVVIGSVDYNVTEDIEKLRKEVRLNINLREDV